MNWFHGRAATYERGCRCVECRAANTRRHAEKRARRRGPDWVSGQPMPPVHGTRSRYRKGCRCDACRRAESDYQTFRRHRAMAS